MDSSDVVDPADAALHELLAHMAERTPDPDRREKIPDLMLTVAAVARWPPEAFDQWRATCEYIRSLRRDLQRRELEQMCDASGDDETHNNHLLSHRERDSVDSHHPIPAA
jgi:hypothetical protein